MTLEEELLLHLNDEKETFTTKLQYATNFFKSSELPVQCKIILLKWILSNTDQKGEIWIILQNWLSSNHFREITRNEIDSKDIKSIVEAIIKQITLEVEDLNITKTICNTVITLLGNKIFEQYFKFEVKLYLKLINCTLLRIECPNYFIEFLGLHLFYKSLLNTHDFIEQFVNIIFPTLVKCITKWDNKSVFLQISRVVQKCIFYNNHKNFGNFINQVFGREDADQCELKILINYLSKVFESNKKSVELHFKLSFHACAVSYESDSLIIYKYFLILIHICGFRYEVIPLTNSLINNSMEIQQTKKSQKILLELLEVLEETKLDINCKVNELTFTELLKTILTDSIIPNKPSNTNYKIIKKIISLDPTISQTLTENILNYSLLTNNLDQNEEYEELMLVIFELFSKLHRIENLISKIVIVLNNHFNENNEKTVDIKNLRIENVLTEKILQSFSKNIQSLASWQVINVFKTFLYALRRLLENKNGVENDKISYCLHMEFLSELIGVFLSSIRVAEHTVAANVVEKTKKCLKELEHLLHMFGKELLNRKHNCSLMRSFLSIAYHWAEVGIILRYYSANQEETPKKSSEYNFSSCNITYLHPYLSIEEWCQISERITNFGELPCKHLLHKLFIQKVRALYIFEQKMNDESLSDLSRYLTADLENSWKDILQNKFLSKTLIPTLDATSKNFLAEKLLVDTSDFESFHKNSHIFNNDSILNAVVYCTIIKCDKILSKRKRKHDDDSGVTKKISTQICNVMTLDQFYSGNEQVDCINKISKIYKTSNQTVSNKELKFNEEKILELLEVLRKFPVIFCQEYVQKFFVLYIFSLHKDLNPEFTKGNHKNVQKSVENLIMGVLQQYKYRLTDIFNLELLCQEILNNFDEWKEIFILIIDNIFKNKDAIVDYESLILHIADMLHNPTYMQCGIIIINTVNKLKKVKMSKEIKTVAERYRSIICNKICDLVLKNEPNDHLIPGYAYALKTAFAQNEEDQISKLLNVLDSYTNFALERKEEFDKIGYLLLFNTVLQNKPKIKDFNEDFLLKIWLVCKTNKQVFFRMEEYSQLILLMICYISNEQFSVVIGDLYVLSKHSLEQNNNEEFGFLLKTWESIFTSNINPVKTKNLQEEIQKLLTLILTHLENSEYNSDFYENLLKFEITLVQTNHFHLSPPMIDILILHVTVLLGKQDIDFQLFFNLAISLLSNLLKYRKSLIMDRLPPYLQQYRALLRSLCQKSDSDVPKNEDVIRVLADCAFQLEKLTKSLTIHQKDMSRIAMYLIADILEQYEKVTIYPNIKMHLNNCIYSLITICDQHAISYLMRVLSSASTEIFKVMYENYKKYYRFTGKA